MGTGMACCVSLHEFPLAKFEISPKTQGNISKSENSTVCGQLSQNLNIGFSLKVPDSK